MSIIHISTAVDYKKSKQNHKKILIKFFTAYPVPILFNYLMKKNECKQKKYLLSFSNETHYRAKK